MSEERRRRSWMSSAATAVGVIGLIALAYLVVRNRAGDEPGEIAGNVIGALAIPAAIVAGARGLYVRFIDPGRSFFSAPWLAMGTFLLALVLVPTTLENLREQDVEEVGDELAAAKQTCAEREVEAFPDLPGNYEYQALPARVDQQLAASLPYELREVFETADVSGPGAGAVVIAAPLGDVEAEAQGALDGFERTAEVEGLSTETRVLDDGTELTFAEVAPRTVTGVALGSCHFRSFTSQSLDTMIPVVLAIAAEEKPG